MTTMAMELVRPGELKLARGGGVLAAIGLGSCVAVALHDAEVGLGGLCHALLPHPLNGRPAVPRGRFATLAIPALVEMLEAAGADRRRLTARLVGGASMFPGLVSEGGRAMGERNIEACRQALAEAGIRITGEQVGGTYGRSAYFHPEDGRIIIRTVRSAEVVL